MLDITRYASAEFRFGLTKPGVQGSGFRHIESVRPQNRLRHASTSPTCACTLRKSPTPVDATAFSRRPAMKSIFTASREQPWNMNRGRKPERGKKLFAFSTSAWQKTFSHGTKTF